MGNCAQIPPPDLGVLKRRRLTYQIAMRGIDGIVLASDRLVKKPGAAWREDRVSVDNETCKIYKDANGKFAWSFAGDDDALNVAEYYSRRIGEWDRKIPLAEFLEECADAVVQSREQASYEVIFLDGVRRELLLVDNRRGHATASLQTKGICFAGQSSNRASVLASYYYRNDLSVGALVQLAAYSVKTAGIIDPEMIRGIDVFIYRDSNSIVEELPRETAERAAAHLESGICSLVQSFLLP